MLMTIFVLAIERRTIATSVFQSFYRGNSIFFGTLKLEKHWKDPYVED